MVEERTQRRLAAILAADVVGFSRLMGADESGAMAALKVRRKDVLDPLVAKHQGRIFKTTGDGVLIEFASAVNAVQCAVELQQGMAIANSGKPEDYHIVLRIGVNLGDVIVEGSDLYGDGINIAARLESVAEPGGILVSSAVHDHVGTKIKVGFKDMGVQTLKNIAQPVRAYRVTNTPTIEVAAPKSVPDKLSIAVLPFTNMSGDPEQQYFSDGITEDIITELARDRSLLVIARNACFQFRGPAADIAAVRRALGVRYIVEGSVRRTGDRIRVTAQLIDAVSQSHLWAERYDRNIQDIFTVQDEVTRAIVATLLGRLLTIGAEYSRHKPTKDWVAYDYFLQGRNCDYHYDLKQSVELFRRATELDPDFAQAHAWLASQLCFRYLLDESPETIEEAAVHAQRALALNENDAYAHNSMGWAALRRREFDLAGQHFDQAVNLSPHDVSMAVDWANWLMYVNRLDDALGYLGDLLQRDSYPPTYIWEVRGQTQYFLRRHEEAIASLRRMHGKHFWTPMFRAAAFAQLGQETEARRELGDFLEARPKASLDSVAKKLGYADKALGDHLLDGLRKAGLPE
ncbi:adenylate/guanylate cyclase domain-containing protein [Nordella sp. HKS 07]|uniref:adenylate/guanylate cyclase domain-containing protein n=1 Tax=Nordella sp. HKS 07 TaxID=2712222 RepID=UPI0013E1B47B|nr:adenylate/guanylate cyclase domain-containing protein [Nordella sp. HKS 07]QIG46561.1 adenylate/guanylate cyclase domain-containing protein [Nordella sp. HKS 07]